MVSLFSQHGRVLVEIAKNPQVRVPDLAQLLGVTDRAAQRVVAALVEEGYVSRRRDGRRVLFSVVSEELKDQMLGLDGFETVPAAPSHTRRDDIQVRLLAAAEMLVDAAGTFSGFSVEDLLRASGVSRSTFYVFYKDKDDLLQALIENLQEELSAAARAWTSLGGGLTKADLRRALMQIGATHRPHRMALAAAAAAGPANANVKAQYDSLMAAAIDLIRDHISRGQAEGFINPDLDPAATAALLTWAAELRLSKFSTDADPGKLDLVLEAFTGLVWNLLYAGRV